MTTKRYKGNRERGNEGRDDNRAKEGKEIQINRERERERKKKKRKREKEREKERERERETKEMIKYIKTRKQREGKKM